MKNQSTPNWSQISEKDFKQQLKNRNFIKAMYTNSNGVFQLLVELGNLKVKQAKTSTNQAILEALNNINAKLVVIDTRLNKIEARLDRVETRLDDHSKQLKVINERLDRVEERLDEHTEQLKVINERLDEHTEQLRIINKRLDNHDAIFARHNLS